MEQLTVEPKKFGLAAVLGISSIRAKEIDENFRNAMNQMSKSHHDDGDEFVSTGDEIAAAVPIAHDEKELAYVMFITGLQDEKMHQFQEHVLSLLGDKGEEMRNKMKEHLKKRRQEAQKPIDDLLNGVLKKGDDE